MSADLIAVLAVGAVDFGLLGYLIVNDVQFRLRMSAWGDNTLRRLLDNRTEGRE